MGKQGELPLHAELIQGEKKLNKRKHHLQECLQKARESKERAEERLQRMQARMQNRAARVQRLEEQLRETYRQLQGDSHTIVLDISYTDSLMSDVQASQEYSDKAVEQQVSEDASVMPASEEVTMTTDVMQSADLITLSDAIVQAQDARYAADVAREAVCRALARVQAATCRLDQYGVARHLDQELTQMQQEIEQVSQIAQEKEQAATQAEQLIQPFVLLPVDEESESESR